MKTCEFRVVVHGAQESRAALITLVRSLPRSYSPKHPEPAVMLDSILSDVPKSSDTPEQTWFWVSGEFLVERPGEVVIVGTTVDAPPLRFLQALQKRFPTLAFDCYSSTDREWYEHWRVGLGIKRCELIEELVVDPKTGAHQKHFLKDGAESRFTANQGWNV